jgi:hypothetical protein
MRCISRTMTIARVSARALRKSFSLPQMIFGHRPQDVGVTPKRGEPRESPAQLRLLPVPFFLCHHTPRIFTRETTCARLLSFRVKRLQLDLLFTDP